MIQSPSIPHFKGLGMRNLQYEMIICQKTHNKVTMTMSSNFHFCKFCQFSEIHEKLSSCIIMNTFGYNYCMGT